jgi:hypothetical protein
VNTLHATAPANTRTKILVSIIGKPTRCTDKIQAYLMRRLGIFIFQEGVFCNFYLKGRAGNFVTIKDEND